MRFEATPADSADARQMLTEYFTSRELGFVGGEYRIVQPDPGMFEPPTGVFLLVRDDDDRVVGCGGIRRIGDDDSGAVRYEVKHLWLRDETRGRGWGRALLVELEALAAAFGAAIIVLDTNESLTAAGALYRSAGYASVPPYNENVNATTWYAKRLP